LEFWEFLRVGVSRHALCLIQPQCLVKR
jgi:hypothetical protein